MQRRRLLITLPSDAYRLLEQLARREERATDQQASFLLRRTLAEVAAAGPSADQEAPVDAG